MVIDTALVECEFLHSALFVLKETENEAFNLSRRRKREQSGSR